MRRFPLLLAAATTAFTVVPISTALAHPTPHGAPEASGSCTEETR
jgi:hypothetical protein